MYAEERQQAMAELVARRGRVSVADLAARFGVTTETVRRDLDTLEEPPPAAPRARGRASRRSRSPSSRRG